MNADLGRLITFTGPSGVGKNSIIDGVKGKFGFVEVVSTTTRQPRIDSRTKELEVDGFHYEFVSRESFIRDMEIGSEFLETNYVGGDYPKHFYGTRISSIVPDLSKGITLIHDIEHNGLVQIRESLSMWGYDVISYFIMPPSMVVLEKRLRQSGNAKDEYDLQARMRQAQEKIEFYNSHKDDFDYCVVNDDLDRAVEEIIAGFKSKN
ncbi:MAG: guanylate kinase [bacterium]